jgi:hypothetical protein
MGHRSNSCPVRDFDTKHLTGSLSYFLYTRPEVTEEFMVSVSMHMDGDDCRLLGFMELSGLEFYDTTGRKWGM